MQLRPRRERAADVPGVGRTADGPVDEVQGIGDGVEHHARAAEDARPLAHAAGHRLAIALDRRPPVGRGRSECAVSSSRARPAPSAGALGRAVFARGAWHHITSSKLSSGTVGVLAVEEGIEDLFDQTHAAHVPGRREVLVAHPVHDREAVPNERDPLVAGHVLAVGSAEEQIHPLLLDPLMEQQHVGRVTARHAHLRAASGDDLSRGASRSSCSGSPLRHNEDASPCRCRTPRGSPAGPDRPRGRRCGRRGTAACRRAGPRAASVPSGARAAPPAFRRHDAGLRRSGRWPRGRWAAPLSRTACRPSSRGRGWPVPRPRAPRRGRRGSSRGHEARPWWCRRRGRTTARPPCRHRAHRSCRAPG